MVEEHRFPGDEAVSSIVTMNEAPRALAAWSENPSRVKKIMIRMD